MWNPLKHGTSLETNVPSTNSCSVQLSCESTRGQTCDGFRCTIRAPSLRQDLCNAAVQVHSTTRARHSSAATQCTPCAFGPVLQSEASTHHAFAVPSIHEFMDSEPIQRYNLQVFIRLHEQRCLCSRWRVGCEVQRSSALRYKIPVTDRRLVRAFAVQRLACCFAWNQRLSQHIASLHLVEANSTIQASQTNGHLGLGSYPRPNFQLSKKMDRSRHSAQATICMPLVETAALCVLGLAHIVQRNSTG